MVPRVWDDHGRGEGARVKDGGGSGDVGGKGDGGNDGKLNGVVGDNTSRGWGRTDFLAVRIISDLVSCSLCGHPNGI